MNKLQELYQREMLFRVSSTLQNNHAYTLEQILLSHKTFPGSDHVKLKKTIPFVFTDQYGTYFQQSGAMTLYLDNVLEMDLCSYTPEHIEAMRKQHALDMMYEKCYTSLFQYLDEFELTYKDKRFYPIGMYIKMNMLMLHGSFSPERTSTDVFCNFTQLSKTTR